jgi:hypothetical protein
MKGTLVPRIDGIAALFLQPLLIMRKREDKLLDHNRVLELQAKGEKVGALCVCMCLSPAHLRSSPLPLLHPLRRPCHTGGQGPG